MSRKNGGPAFPMATVTVLSEDGTPNECASITHGGMSLRDYFAAKAMQSTMLNDEEQKYWVQDYSPEEAAQFTAKRAYEYADAMIAERSKL